MNSETTKAAKRYSTRELVMMAMTIAVISICSYISIPIPPSGYHVTILNFAVMLIALIFPWDQSAMIIAAWLLLGITGLPVFVSGNAGIGYLTGPLGGYTVSFLPTAVLLSLLRGQKHDRIRCTAATLLTAVLVDLAGTVWLKISGDMPWAAAWAAGFFPFLPLDLVKAVAAAQIAPSFQKIARTQSFL